MAKATLSSVPYYSMQTVDLPQYICDEIEKKTRGFVWGSTDKKKKIHLLNWEEMKKDKSAGALGMRSMQQGNVAFMAKMGWRVLTDPESLWARVVMGKYCDGRLDRDMFTAKKGASKLWGGMVKAEARLLEGV